MIVGIAFIQDPAGRQDLFSGQQQKGPDRIVDAIGGSEGQRPERLLGNDEEPRREGGDKQPPVFFVEQERSSEDVVQYPQIVKNEIGGQDIVVQANFIDVVLMPDDQLVAAGTDDRFEPG